MAHIILFNDYWLRGDHRHIVADEPNLAAPDDSSFNDRTKSFAILSGNWQLFLDINYANPFPKIYGPGIYELADAADVTDNALSSLRTTTQPATISGDVPPGYVTLFENAGFRGGHRHVFTDTPDLSAANLPAFNDVTSSLVISRWTISSPRVQLCADANYGRPYAKLLGTGAYDYVGNFGLPNDDLSSLQISAGPSEPAGIVHGDESFGEIILFENEQFRGRHRHVYTAEPDLGAADDNAFAHIASSMAIVRGAWALCRQPNYQQIMPAWDLSGFGQTPNGPGFNWNNLQAPKFFLPGTYPSLSAIGVDNDAVMSLHMPLPDIYIRDVEDWYVDVNNEWADDVWFIFVTGPHAPGTVKMSAGGWNETDQGPPPGFADRSFHEIGSYVDTNGNAWAHAYCFLNSLHPNINTQIDVSCDTQGAYGSTVKTNHATYQEPQRTPPPPPPSITVTVPNVVGKTLTAANQALAAVGLVSNTIMPAGISQTDLVQVRTQSPSAGAVVQRGSTVDLAVVPISSTPSGCSVVHIFNENTDGTAYEIWTYTGGQWKDEGKAVSVYDPASNSVPPGAQPYNVTPDNGKVVEIAVMPLGSNPQSTTPRAQVTVTGNSAGSAQNWVVT